MDISAVKSLLLGDLNAANSYLESYEPLVLVATPLVGIFIGTTLQSAIAVLRKKGVKATLLALLMSFVKVIPGVKKYIDAEKQKVVDQLQSGGSSKRESWRSELPSAGLGGGVIDKMKEEKRKDVAWQGRCSGTVYIGGSELEGHFSIINEACSMFAHTNPLHMYSRALFGLKLKWLP